MPGISVSFALNQAQYPQGSFLMDFSPCNQMQLEKKTLLPDQAMLWGITKNTVALQVAFVEKSHLNTEASQHF